MPSREYEEVAAMTDPAYQVTEEKKQKIRKPKFYPSGETGAVLKNAVTGLPTGVHVGSLESLQFFEVVDVTGKYDAQGFKYRRGEGPNKDPVRLFFDSPEQAERCFKHSYAQMTKSLWHYKTSYLFPVTGDSRDGLEQRYRHWRSLSRDQQIAMAGLSKVEAEADAPETNSDDEW